MFAPKFAKQQAKTAESSPAKPGSRIATSSRNRLGDPAAQMYCLQGPNNGQAMPRLLNPADNDLDHHNEQSADPSNQPPQETRPDSARHVSWIPPFPPHELVATWHIGLTSLTEQRGEAAALSPSLQRRVEARIGGASLGNITLHRGPAAERARPGRHAVAAGHGSRPVL